MYTMLSTYYHFNNNKLLINGIKTEEHYPDYKQQYPHNLCHHGGTRESDHKI